MGPIAKNPEQRLLDVGCGLGGTAGYLARHGWGQALGVDIDPELIAYASKRYPDVSFRQGSAADLATHFGLAQFDVLYSFNAFYCFAEQGKCLRAMADVAKENATLMIFDYSSPDEYKSGDIFYNDAPLHASAFRPINLSRIDNELAQNGWKLTQTIDVTTQFQGWYEALQAKMATRRGELCSRFGQETFDALFGAYARLLSLMNDGKLGGALLYCHK
jgi:phosphoethanolamine N-methyltransferase